MWVSRYTDNAGFSNISPMDLQCSRVILVVKFYLICRCKNALNIFKKYIILVKS